MTASKCFYGIILLATLFLFSSLAIASSREPSQHDEYESHHVARKEKQNHHGRKKHSKKKKNVFEHIIKAADKIGLTAEQVQEVREIGYDYKKDHIKLKSEIKIAEVELQEVLEAEEFSENEVVAATNKIAELMADCYRRKSAAMIDVIKALTSEQRKMVNSMHDSGMYSRFFDNHH